MYYKIIPVFNGSFSIDFAGIFGVRQNDFPFNPVIRNSPSLVFLLIEENEKALLVDTGFDEKYIWGFPPHASFQREEKDLLHLALSAHGYQPEDISTVIITHLHWDHTGGMKYFPNADFFVQVAEFKTLTELETKKETAYHPEHWLPLLSQLRLVNGDIELRPGINLLFTGGHTPGHQAVEINTRSGPVILGGDLLFDYTSLWEDLSPDTWERLKTGPGKDMFWKKDLAERINKWFSEQETGKRQSESVPGIKKLESRGARVLFSHDPKLINTGIIE